MLLRPFVSRFACPERAPSSIPERCPRFVPGRHRFLSGSIYGVLISGLAILLLLGGITSSAIAGDILRGGGSFSSTGHASTPGSFTPPAAVQARQNAQDMLARTTRALQSVKNMQLAARAIAAASGNNLNLPNPNNPSVKLPPVTDGLQPGGLVPLTPATWTGATAPTETTSGANHTVTIDQTSQNAILTWSSFNVGSHTTLDFNQSKGGSNVGTWIAFNLVTDPSGVPSQILGSINAPGQVYVINRNGILFGGGAQVNVHALVASSLQINSSMITGGLLNNPDSQFLFSAVANAPGANGTPNGDVIVEPGAQLSAPTTASHVGGRIALIGPNVINNGDISTPDGQTILAAGLQVGIAASTDPTLRGLNVYVGEVADPNYPAAATAGKATNNGEISTPRGDAYITGKIVSQNGVIDSTTSVTLNGRVDLLADYGAIANSYEVDNKTPGLAGFIYPTNGTGTVELGQDSAIRILPEDSSATVVGSQLALNSTVRIEGQNIHFGQGSTLLAPSASVTVDAGFWTAPHNGVQDILYYSTATNSPQVYFDADAVVDLAGSTDVSASVLQNIIQAQLLGAQLANSPIERALFHGQTITIDVRQQGVYNGIAWVGTPLADATGYAGLIESTVAELTIAGGQFTVNAGGSVVMQQGSKVDVSGGFIDYAGAVVDTSKVISNGHIYDISQATPDMLYSAIYTGQFTVDHPKYGVQSTYLDPIIGQGHFENGYVYGGNGGLVSFTAPSMALDGQLLGQTSDGSRQLGATSTGPRLQAAPSYLDLSFSAQDPVNSLPDSIFTTFPAPPTITFDGPALTPVGAFALNASGGADPLSSQRLTQVSLSSGLTSVDGFGTLTINDPTGKIIVPAGVTITDPAAIYTNPYPAANTTPAVINGAITFIASDTTIDGSILFPGGRVVLTDYAISPYDAQIAHNSPNPPSSLPVAPDRGIFFLGASASINTAGLLVDDRDGSPTAQQVADVTNGGSITIAAYSADLAAGSSLDVSGGVEVNASGKPAYGHAGAIGIAAGQDPATPSASGGTLILDAALSGFAGLGQAGGTLNILAPLVRIGAPVADSRSFLISPDFFSQGGFTSFGITGVAASGASQNSPLAALVIGQGVTIDPEAQTLILESNLAAGGDVNLVPTLLPQESRHPVNLTFAATGLKDFTGAFVARGDLVLSRGALIESDPSASAAASISLNGDTVAVLGSVIAPAGAISVSGASGTLSVFTSSAFGGNSPSALVTVDLAPGSLLSAAGVLVPTANALGHTTGVVLGGGSVAVKGNIAAESGATIDVSGASAVLDESALLSSVSVPQVGSFAGAVLVPTRVDSNGGQITLSGGEELFVDATLRGAAGGPSALGGSLTLSSGLFIPDSSHIPDPSTPFLFITQGGLTIPVPFYAAGQSAIGRAILGKNGKPIIAPDGSAPGTFGGGGYFAANTFENSGMDSLSLNSNVQFENTVNLSARYQISVGSGGFIYANAPVTIAAPIVSLGQAFQGPLTATQLQNIANGLGSYSNKQFFANPTGGTGKLTVIADLINIGNLSLQGIGTANFFADNGDIRGDGTLDVAGSILMQAGQIYTPTADSFSIFAYDNGAAKGSVTFKASGSRDLPLSAGGVLNVYASTITQDGVLRAPFGQINLGWDGSGTSPRDPLTGAGYTDLNGIPLTNATVPIAQTVTLGAGSITSVSAVDPRNGNSLIIPYGTNENGISWIDPTGLDITAGGAPAKSISISGVNVVDSAGATIDISGGGDLFSYRFVKGTTGTIDFLNAVAGTAYAIIPGFQSGFAPVNETAFSDTSLSGQFGVGRQVYLAASPGVPAGYYTLLPAQYALLPGAFLVTPRTGLPTGTVAQLDGSTLVSGYYVNGLDKGQTGQPAVASFDVASQSVINARGEYDTYLGNSFLTAGAINANQPVPALPQDGGHLILNASQSLTLAGHLDGSAAGPGRGSLVDISTGNANGILITGPGGSFGSGGGQLVLDSATLDSFGAGSLLIGGIRTTSGADGTTVNVTTSKIEVDNQGTPLTGSDIILAATGQVLLDDGAQVDATAASAGIGAITVVGNGALLRVSGSPLGTVLRTGVTSGGSALMSVGAGASISGVAVTLDSSSQTFLDPTATISSQYLALNSGHIILDLGGAASPSNGLLLTDTTLGAFSQGAQSLSLLSYSSIDIYGTGQLGGLGAGNAPLLRNLALHAGAINGFNGASATFNAKTILLDNAPQTTVNANSATNAGSLTFAAGEIELGSGQLNIGSFTSGVSFNATGGILGVATAHDSTGAAVNSNLSTTGAVNFTSPVVTAAKGQTLAVNSGGLITITDPGTATVNGGAGAQVSFTGDAIVDNGNITATAGTITLHATGAGGVQVGTSAAASINAGGGSQSFFDVTRYSNGGQVFLTADSGDVSLGSLATVNVAAVQAGDASAGTLTVSTPAGQFTVDPTATLLGEGGQLKNSSGALVGHGGSFSLDTGNLASTAAINNVLNTAGFTQSRIFRIRDSALVQIDGEVDAANFQLSADQGVIEVTAAGNINASGATGGNITLEAAQGLTLDTGAILNAHGDTFNDAGHGGAVTLETTGGAINLNGGAIDLTVSASPTGSGALQDVTGTLYLRAPQIGGNNPTGVAINPIATTISGASSIVVEGFHTIDASADGSIDSHEAAAISNGNKFMANAAAMATAIIGSNTSFSASILNIRPGEEIDNNSGDLTLSADWDLSATRFGATQAITLSNGQTINMGTQPGVLTLRASGNIIFLGALTDGFGTDITKNGAPVPTKDGNGQTARYLDPLLPLFKNGQSQLSWSYNIAAGADTTAANVLQVRPLTALDTSIDPYEGSVEIGDPSAGENSSGDGTISSAIEGFYQVVRTGAGSIHIAAGRDVQLLNQFATVYTAGAQVGTSIGGATLGGTFDVPVVRNTITKIAISTAQFSYGGGDVSIAAGQDIIHLIDGTLPDGSAGLVDDSVRETPNNWLYRRGYYDATDTAVLLNNERNSTSWWVDFTNFFEGVGALGGGNVSLVAGNDVKNVDAVVPTQARMPKGAANINNLVELGGGDLIVQAGHDINGGIYYVERGNLTLSAGDIITTNATRSPTTTPFDGSPLDTEQTWLPTTLYGGNTTFDVSARGNVLLGPVVNPFWLPSGAGNGNFDSTYFSTFTSTASVKVTSFGGDVTLRDESFTQSTFTFQNILEQWYDTQLGALGQASGLTSSDFYQPWLSISVNDAAPNPSPFSTLFNVMPATLTVTSFSGSINIAADMVLSPSRTGNLELVAAQSINAITVVGANPSFAAGDSWAASEINLSDADPAAIPGIADPDSLFALEPGAKAGNFIFTTALDSINILFNESGATAGDFANINTKQALHANLPGPLHAGDTQPVLLYAVGGDISGLTLFTPKVSRVAAGVDITDIAFYLQNVAPSDFTLVTAGRDILPFDNQSPLRLVANEPQNSIQGIFESALAGDISIGGPGTLEVLAGRNVTMGVSSASNDDGTGVGITTIGQTANLSLPFTGADAIVAAGLGSSSVAPGGGLSGSQLDFASFISQFVEGPAGARYLADLAQSDPGLNVASLADFQKLDPEQQDNVALQIFYLVLRDAGRDHNDAASPGFGNYTAGLAAIASLIPHSGQSGDVDLTSREIKTTSGGNISILVPAGKLTVGIDLGSKQPVDQGILTEDGGNINIFTNQDVIVGTSRIFTLRGGNELIWSTVGNIAAGAASKTVQSAPPTRVLVDPQSADVKTDLAGLATGGGIGVLASVVGVAPGSVDLIAPSGIIDAGDAGIRATGNLNLAATQVLNASNIQAGGASSGVPTVSVAAPNLGAIAASSAAVGATQASANAQANSQNQNQNDASDQPSIIDVTVLGYGGSDSDSQGG